MKHFLGLVFPYGKLRTANERPEDGEFALAALGFEFRITARKILTKIYCIVLKNKQ